VLQLDVLRLSSDSLSGCRSVLIESATDVERVAGALATLAPLVPGLRYFRCAEHRQVHSVYTFVGTMDVLA